jgi:hypothetical protein
MHQHLILETRGLRPEEENTTPVLLNINGERRTPAPTCRLMVLDAGMIRRKQTRFEAVIRGA